MEANKQQAFESEIQRSSIVTTTLLWSNFMLLPMTSYILKSYHLMTLLSLRVIKRQSWKCNYRCGTSCGKTWMWMYEQQRRKTGWHRFIKKLRNRRNTFPTPVDTQTWNSPNGRDENPIYQTMVNEKWRRSLIDVKMRGVADYAVITILSLPCWMLTWWVLAKHQHPVNVLTHTNWKIVKLRSLLSTS